MAVFLYIGIQTINQIATTSGIFSGENVQQGWSSINKSNNTLYINGHFNLAINNIDIINDPDLIDNPTNQPNVDVTAAPVILDGI